MPEESALKERSGDVPAPAVGKSRRWAVSLVWAVPLIALAIGLSLAVQAIREKGPTITVDFASAEGIEPGKTKVKFKDVDIGEVKAVRLAEDRSRVVVVIDLVKEAAQFAVSDTRFWVVRPRLAGTRISGLATLFSGSYIGVDAGHSTDSQTEFSGLEQPPVVASDVPGRRFTLHAADIGSLDIESPIFFRRILVGHVESFALEPQGREITLKVWINSPYDRFVTTETRFWHASGVDLRVGAEGVRLETQSLATILMGGVAFETPQGTTDAVPAKNDTQFTLATDRGEAMKKPDGTPLAVLLRFRQSVRGLTVGAPVDFRGVEIGSVTSVGVAYEPATHSFNSPVAIEIYPDRLGAAGMVLPGGEDRERRQAFLPDLVARGLRAQLRVGNLLTGQLYVAADFFPDFTARLDPRASTLEVPTVASDMQELQEQIASLLKKLNQIPLDTLSQDAHRAMVSLDAAIRRLDAVAGRANSDLLPQMRAALEEVAKTMEAAQASLAPDAPLEQDARQVLRGLNDATRSLKAFTDTLNRNPEALVRGKKGQKE